MKQKYTSLFKTWLLKFAAKNNFLILKDNFSASYNKKIIEKNSNPVMVNVGAGSFSHPLWINLDFSNKFYRSVQSKKMLSHNLASMERFPFQKDSVNFYYCSHVIEHLNDKFVLNMFNEIYRSLKPGGGFRIVCPDIKYIYDDFKYYNADVCQKIRPWGEQYNEKWECFLEYFATFLVHKNFSKLTKIERENLFYDNLKNLRMDDFFEEYIEQLPENVNSIMPYGHCNWFTFDKLNHMLLKSGFKYIYKSEFCKSMFMEFRSPCFFDSTTPEISLFIEAVK